MNCGRRDPKEIERAPQSNPNASKDTPKASRIAVQEGPGNPKHHFQNLDTALERIQWFLMSLSGGIDSFRGPLKGRARAQRSVVPYHLLVHQLIHLHGETIYSHVDGVYIGIPGFTM